MDDQINLVYRSVPEMVDAIINGQYRVANRERINDYLADDRGEQWHGIAGGAIAVQAAVENGYPEGAETIRDFHSRIMPELPIALDYKRSLRRSDQGDELDIHAVYRGALDRAWSKSSRVVRKGSGIIRVVCDIGGNADTGAKALRWRGIAGLSLSEALTRAGYSVEICAALGVRHYTQTPLQPPVGTLLVTVKSRTARANLGLLAATVALPGFFRVYGFGAICILADLAGGKISNSMGQSIDVAGVLPVPNNVTQLVVPGTVECETTAVDWVKQTVKLLQGATS